MTTNDKQRLQEIRDEFKNLLNEAEQILRGTPGWEQAKAYWYGQMRTALDDDHMYVGKSMCSLQDTIDQLDDEECEEEEQSR